MATSFIALPFLLLPFVVAIFSLPSCFPLRCLLSFPTFLVFLPLANWVFFKNQPYFFSPNNTSYLLFSFFHLPYCYSLVSFCSTKGAFLSSFQGTIIWFFSFPLKVILLVFLSLPPSSSPIFLKLSKHQHKMKMKEILCRSSHGRLGINLLGTTLAFNLSSIHFLTSLHTHLGFSHLTITHCSYCQCGHTIDDLGIHLF